MSVAARKELGLSIKAYREYRHSLQKTAKKMHKFFEQQKSRHVVPLDLNYGHKAWSIGTDEIACALCADTMEDIEAAYDKWGRK